MALALRPVLFWAAVLGHTCQSLRFSAPLVGRLDHPTVGGADYGDEILGKALFNCAAAAPPADGEEEELVGEPRAATDTRPTPRPSSRQWLGRRKWVPKPGERKPQPAWPMDEAQVITITGLSIAHMRERRAAQIRANTVAMRERLTAVGYTKPAATEMLNTLWMRSSLQPLPGRDGACTALLQVAMKQPFSTLITSLLHPTFSLLPISLKLSLRKNSHSNPTIRPAMFYCSTTLCTARSRARRRPSWRSNGTPSCSLLAIGACAPVLFPSHRE